MPLATEFNKTADKCQTNRKKAYEEWIKRKAKKGKKKKRQTKLFIRLFRLNVDRKHTTSTQHSRFHSFYMATLNACTQQKWRKKMYVRWFCGRQVHRKNRCTPIWETFVAFIIRLLDWSSILLLLLLTKLTIAINVLASLLVSCQWGEETRKKERTIICISHSVVVQCCAFHCIAVLQTSHNRLWPKRPLSFALGLSHVNPLIPVIIFDYSQQSKKKKQKKIEWMEEEKNKTKERAFVVQ